MEEERADGGSEPQNNPAEDNYENLRELGQPRRSVHGRHCPRPGVGKGTLLSGLGDRRNLIQQVYAVRLAPLREQIEKGPAPLGPEKPPRKVSAIIDAIAVVKLENAHLMLALEGGSGPTNDLYESTDYVGVHGSLT